MELKDKINVGDAIPEGATINHIDIDNEKLSEAVGALIALGYSDKEAEKAVEKADKSKNVEDIIKECLKILMG